ncbi:MAG: hypothetical protein H6708_09555 [Kofleriaceae bacterium]|nr:hypothetical protein [Kofleriaceae bacterium]
MTLVQTATATPMSWIRRVRVISLLGAGLALGACDGPRPVADEADAADTSDSCWLHDCPSDPGAQECGTCTHPGQDHECPVGFVCSCTAVCVKGPRSYDAGVVCGADAGVDDAGTAGPDAQTYDWPDCDMAHLPGT